MSAVASAPTTSHGPERLRRFVRAFTELVETTTDEEALLQRGASLLRGLVLHDDWLPSSYAAADPHGYRQYLLHCDGRERFSVVSFVWGPGQATPIHDHRVWGLVGVLRGAERNEAYARDENGHLVPTGPATVLERGAVVAVSPRLGDVHRVANALSHQTSISIHVYGANIGAVARATYDEAGHTKPFVSGYSNDTLPNLWKGSLAP